MTVESPFTTAYKLLKVTMHGTVQFELLLSTLGPDLFTLDFVHCSWCAADPRTDMCFGYLNDFG